MSKPIKLEATDYNAFLRKFKKKRFGSQRLGLAFIEYFKLDKDLSVREAINKQNLRTKDGLLAKRAIEEIVSFS